MAYLINTARASSLTIGGVNYTQNLVSWSCSDSSAVKNGLMTTDGNLQLGTVPGSSLEDYDRNAFKRGQKIILNITYPDQTTIRHPRGLLYVVGAAYNPETETIDIEMGCRIALAVLSDEADTLKNLPGVKLDPARQNDLSNISGALAAEGKVAYQDNSGSLVVRNFFGNDTGSSFDQGQWVSVLGETTLSVSPLAGSSPLPDGIKLSYQVPSEEGNIVDEEDQRNPDSPNKLQLDSTESYYFLTYPATIYERIGDGEIPNDVRPGSVPTSTDSGCGNTPDEPGDNGQGSCNDNYSLVQSPQVIPAYKIQEAETQYKGPGGQVSSRYSEVRGPAIEANQQYYADLYAYCRYTWATACQPNGGCEMEGLDEILLGYVQQTNNYGPAGEVVSTVTDTFIPTLAGAQPFDWRSGVEKGAPVDFRRLSETTMYRSQRRIEEFSKEGNTNVTTTYTYTSVTAQQSGIRGGGIDALQGQLTKEIRKSTTITGSSVLPDTVNTVETTTIDKVLLQPLFPGSYITPPPESGPYYLEETVPVPVLLETEGEIDAFVQKYAKVLAFFAKGDSLGLQIGEALRKEIAQAWVPGVAFRYCDQAKGKISAMRMDATSWSVTPNEALVVTSGLWIGFSNGTLSMPSNVVGNSTPTMGGGGSPVPPPGADTTPPVIEDETGVAEGARAWIVDINIYTEIEALTQGRDDGVNPPLPKTKDETTADVHSTFMCYVRGIMTETGSLASLESGGNIPLSLNGNLLLSGATVVDGDLFS